VSYAGLAKEQKIERHVSGAAVVKIRSSSG
jgi:hypothetical protein